MTSEFAVTLLLFSLGGYLLLGAVIAWWMHLRGLKLLDPGNRHGSWGYLICVTPGLVALWPILLFACLAQIKGLRRPVDAGRAATPGRLRLLQGLAFFLLLLLIPLLLGTALSWRVPDHRDVSTPVQLRKGS